MGKADKRIRPEDLKGRKEVLVVVRYGQDGEMVKEKPARIIKILRAAAKVHVEGEDQERTIRFSELRIPPDPQPEPNGKRKRRQSRERRGLRAVPPSFNDLSDEAALEAEPESEPKPEPTDEGPVVEHKKQPPPAEPKADPDGELSEWVAQGAKIQQQLDARLKKQEKHLEKLMAEHSDLERRIEDTSNEIERIKQRIGLLQSVQASVQDAD